MTNLHQDSQNYHLSHTGPKTVLLLCCSPREDRHTYKLLRNAGLELSDYPDLTIHLESFAGKRIFACQNCHSHCAREGHCWQNDDFEPIARHWLEADGIILGSPVYSFGPPSSVSAFFERLLALQRANPAVYTSSFWPQPVGIASQGGSEYSGVEICAQTLLSQCLSVGCIPVSGDMPGFSQGIIGQIRDDGNIPEHLAEGMRRLAARLVDLMKIISTGQNPEPVPLRFLIVKAGSPENTLVDGLDATEAQNELLNVPIDWHVFDFNHAHIEPCLGCSEFCASNLECRFHDGMQTFLEEWLAADAIFWLTGYEPGSSFAPLRAAIDRMNQIRFETFFAAGYRHMPRYLKISVPIGSDFETKEPNCTLVFLRQVSLLYQNLLLPYMQSRQIRVSGRQNNNSQAANHNSPAQKLADTIQKSVQLALTINSGLSRLSNSLPEEYFPSKSRFAQNCQTSMKSGDGTPVRDAENPPALV